MQISDDKKAFIFILQSNPVADTANIMTQVQQSGRPVTG
jgi:hypothetical protein